MPAIGPVAAGSAWSTAAAAVTKAAKAFDVAAGTAVAATDPEGSGDIVAGIVGLSTAKAQFEAALAVARTADEMERAVLDILA